MIIDITVTLLTATATATAVNDISVTVVLNDEVVNPEETFCERVDECLGISANGDENKYLNEKGDWTTIQSGGTISQVFMLSRDSSTVTNYDKLIAIEDFTAGVEDSLTVNVGTSPVFIKSFVTNLGGLNGAYYQHGFFTGHYEIEKSAGTNPFITWFELYQRDSGGTETLIATSDNSSGITSNTREQITLSALLSSPVQFNGDALVMKIYAQKVSGANRDITLYWDGNTEAHIDTPSAPIDYVPEDKSNKTSTITGNESSTSLFPNIKGVVDWGLSTFAPITNPITQFSAFTHFTEIFPGIGAGATGAGVWELGNGWVLARNSSGAVATPQAAEVGRPGIVRHSIGATNGYNQIRCGDIWVSSAPLLFKGHFRIQTLSGGGQTFVISCGFSHGGTLVSPTDAIRIFLTVANVLQVEVIKSSVSLVVNTGITVAIGTHYDIVITKADTTNECQFYVNGVNVYSLTNPADIATYVPQNLSMECHNSFQKVHGTNDRTFDTDFAYVTNNLPI